MLNEKYFHYKWMLEVRALSRPVKCRRVCCMPDTAFFAPFDVNNEQNQEVADIIMTVEEFEALRQMDYHSLTQEECAQKMCVARTTLQRIYAQARYKMAQALVEGRPLRIQGGNFKVCDGREKFCGCTKCHLEKKNSFEKKGKNHE